MPTQLDPAAPAVPDGACDAHLHVFDPRFPEVPGPRLTATPPAATAADYRKLRERMGTTRAVIV